MFVLCSPGPSDLVANAALHPSALTCPSPYDPTGGSPAGGLHVPWSNKMSRKYLNPVFFFTTIIATILQCPTFLLLPVSLPAPGYGSLAGPLDPL